MDYKNKYIKYKLKYKNLKNSINIIEQKLQIGGKKKWFVVMESWSDYLATLNEKDTKINDEGKKNCDYIYDIFRGIKEKDLLMCVTKEFIIVPSAAKPFEELDKTHFNLLVMPFDKKLRTIRDLNKIHIPLLNRMVEKIYQVLDYYLGNDNYDKKNIRFEFHYTPSSYHLHLHCQYNPLPHDNNKRHFYYKLDDIISNLKSNSNFYKKPIKIKVKNINEWKNMIKKYSIKKGEKFESAQNVEDFSLAYKIFTDMDCFKLFN